mgnify:CR=1 FL=1
MERDKARTTMLVISMGFLALHLLYDWRWAVYVSLAVGVIGIVSPFLSGKIARGWMMLAKLLGYIVPNILLGIIFYFFLFPISLLWKLFKKDPLMMSGRYESYFVEVEREPEKEDFEKIW